MSILIPAGIGNLDPARLGPVGPPATLSDPASTILHGDCLHALGPAPEGCAGLVFADPPYDFGLDYGEGISDRKGAGYYRWLIARLCLASRLLRPGGSLWILIPHEHAADVDFRLRNPWPYGCARPLHRIQAVVWYETFGVNNRKTFNRCSRMLLWYSNDPDTRLLDPTRPELRKASARSLAGDPRAAGDGTKLFDDVWTDIPRLAGTHRERLPWARTQLPLALCRRVVAASSNPGDLIVDPFAGSGTMGVAAAQAGRRFLGVEADSTRAALASLRIMQETHRWMTSPPPIAPRRRRTPKPKPAPCTGSPTTTSVTGTIARG